MEADCQDTKPSSFLDPDQPDAMQRLFTSLSNHISLQTDRIQEQLQLNDMKLTITQENFKTEVQNELDNFRALLVSHYPSIVSQPSDLSPQPATVVSSNPTVSSGLPSPVPMSQSVVSNVPGDIQSQMMLMLTESFSKLSTVLTDQKPDSKVEWHKFSGESKKFCAWYLGIMAHISLPPWTELYDSIRNDVVTTTSNHLLNGKLYSKVLLALDGTAYQNFVTRKHLRANGIRLLHELVQTYKPKNVPEVIATKTVEFWGNTKRLPLESIDSYYDRFQELLKDLIDADEPISTRAEIRQFIFTLGSEFETIQNNFRINNLPDEWKTQDWPALLTLYRDYYNSVKLQGVLCKNISNIKDQSFDREAHQKKVREWFMSPQKFGKEIEAIFTIYRRLILLLHVLSRMSVINFWRSRNLALLLSLVLVYLVLYVILLRILLQIRLKICLLIHLTVRLMILMMMFWPTSRI
jgi:hypothetical protein